MKQGCVCSCLLYTSFWATDHVPEIITITWKFRYTKTAESLEPWVCFMLECPGKPFCISIATGFSNWFYRQFCKHQQFSCPCNTVFLQKILWWNMKFIHEDGVQITDSVWNFLQIEESFWGQWNSVDDSQWGQKDSAGILVQGKKCSKRRFYQSAASWTGSGSYLW